MSLDALVEGLFDYAGMYPPASLPLEKALELSASFPATLRRPGMVAADLVLGFDRLPEVGPERLLPLGFGPQRPFRACVLASGELAAEAEALRRVEAPRRVVSYEVKLPAGSFDPAPLRPLAGSPFAVFVEPDLSAPGWEEGLRSLCAALAELRLGLKVRCSGPAAAGPEKITRAVAESCRRSLALKATAGLHHPIIERERYGNALGFLSLRAAALLRRALGPAVFPEERLLECLLTEDAADFRFEAGLAWRGFSIDESRLREAREGPHFSVGSCSLHEPDEDLVRLFGQP